MRRVECRSSRANETVAAHNCKTAGDNQALTHYEPCEAGECPHWQYGSWSSCSNECGEGIRRRLLVCLAPDGLVTSESACVAEQRPDDYERCVGHAASCSRWTTSLWSDCDFKTCTKVRTVYCAHENGTRLLESECNKTDKPNYIAECDSRASCKHYQTIVGGLSSGPSSQMANGNRDYKPINLTSVVAALG